jgi:hypothetical protein
MAIAKAAAAEAARVHAPGLLNAQQAGGTHAQSGRWIRKGNSIVLVGI